MISSGYAVILECLSNHECEEIDLALVDSGISRSRASARHLMCHPAVASLAVHAKLIELAEEWLRGAAIPFRATLFEKSSVTNTQIRSNSAPVFGWL